MFHDSYETFLPDSWLTKTFDDIFIKWILRGHFVSFCIVFLECSSFYFHPELYRFLDHCFSVSSSFILLLNIKHQCHWRNKRTISPECTKNRGHAPPEKKKIVIPWSESNAINSYVYFVAVFSETRYSRFPSRSTKIHDSPVLKTKIHDSYKFCNNDPRFMIPLPPPNQNIIDFCIIPPR